jgi:Ca2+-binding EF-hand superfamily protein
MMDSYSIQAVFEQIDTNHNGFLEPEEIRIVMQGASVDITDEELDIMIRNADTNGDGRIDIQEFKRLLADF